MDAQFSAQYTAALTLLRGRPRLASFEADTIRSDEEVIELASRVTTVEHARDTSELTPVEIHLELSDGRTEDARVEIPSGHPDNPLTREELLAKLDDNLSYAATPLAEEKRAEIERLLSTLPESSDVAGLLRAL